MNVPILQTERLELHLLRRDDAPALHAAFGSAAAMQWWDTPAFADVGATAEMIERQCTEMETGSHCYWSVFIGGAGAAVGVVDLSDIDADRGTAEVGFIFAEACWNHGYATEAMRALIDHAESALGLRQLGARCHVGNDASMRLLERLGFRCSRRVAAGACRDGVLRDCLIYARTGEN